MANFSYVLAWKICFYLRRLRLCRVFFRNNASLLGLNFDVFARSPLPTHKQAIIPSNHAACFFSIGSVCITVPLGLCTAQKSCSLLSLFSPKGFAPAFPPPPFLVFRKWPKLSFMIAVPPPPCERFGKFGIAIIIRLHCGVGEILPFILNAIANLAYSCMCRPFT